MSKSNYKRINVLASEAYLQGDPLFVDLLLTLSPFMNVMIDSGAHTNFRILRQKSIGKDVQMEPITLRNYIRSCLDQYHGKVFRYVSLDVIRNPQETETNLNEMLNAGLKPMPVFIEGWGTNVLESLLKIDERICVAGGVGSSDHYIRKRFIDIFRDSGDRALIHGLGFYRWPDVFQLPISTSDSSSWCAGSQYGHVKMFDPKRGVPSIQWTDLFKGKIPERKTRDAFIQYLIRDCRIPRETLVDPDSYNGRYGIPAMVSTLAYIRASDFSTSQGFNYFMAVVDSEWLTVILSVLHSINETGFDYPRSREVFFRFRETRKKNKSKFLQLCHTVAKDSEGWKNDPPLI